MILALTCAEEITTSITMHAKIMQNCFSPIIIRYRSHPFLYFIVFNILNLILFRTLFQINFKI